MSVRPDAPSPLPLDIRLLYPVLAQERLEVGLAAEQHDLLEPPGHGVLEPGYLLPCADAGADDRDLPGLIVAGDLFFAALPKHRSSLLSKVRATGPVGMTRIVYYTFCLLA